MKNAVGAIFCAALLAYLSICGLATWPTDLARDGRPFVWWHPALALGVAAAAGLAIFLIRASGPCADCVHKDTEIAKLRDALKEGM